MVWFECLCFIPQPRKMQRPGKFAHTHARPATLHLCGGEMESLGCPNCWWETNYKHAYFNAYHFLKNFSLLCPRPSSHYCSCGGAVEQRGSSPLVLLCLQWTKNKYSLFCPSCTLCVLVLSSMGGWGLHGQQLQWLRIHTARAVFANRTPYNCRTGAGRSEQAVRGWGSFVPWSGLSVQPLGAWASLCTPLVIHGKPHRQVGHTILSPSAVHKHGSIKKYTKRGVWSIFLGGGPFLRGARARGGGGRISCPSCRGCMGCRKRGGCGGIPACTTTLLWHGKVAVVTLKHS